MTGFFPRLASAVSLSLALLLPCGLFCLSGSLCLLLSAPLPLGLTLALLSVSCLRSGAPELFLEFLFSLADILEGAAVT